MTVASKTSRFDLALIAEEGNEAEHICATCLNRERVVVTTDDGLQTSAMWRCRPLTQQRGREVLIQPAGSCIDAHSVTDYWEEAVEGLKNS